MKGLEHGKHIANSAGTARLARLEAISKRVFLGAPTHAIEWVVYLLARLEPAPWLVCGLGDRVQRFAVSKSCEAILKQ